MNFGEFKQVVQAFAAREPGELQRFGQDLLTLSINNAKRQAEQLIDFEYSKLTVSVGLTNGVGDLRHARAVVGSNPVHIKRIVSARVSGTPVRFVSQQHWNNRLSRRTDGGWTDLMLVQHGRLVKIAGESETSSLATSVELDVVSFLPSYVADLDSDFLLEYCEPYMKARSVAELDSFLRRDSLAVTLKLLEDAWAATVAWNTGILNGFTDSTDLS